MKDMIAGFNPADSSSSVVDFCERKTLLQENQTTSQLMALKTTNDGEETNSETIEEKFRIDRKKLEAMLKGGNDVTESAELFFQRVMDETKAIIIWPSKLKIGAKSKKDPHVKVVGRPNQVQLAKEKIMEHLDVKKSRICLKIDVAYPDHSHLIGKRGANIQEIMGLTKCQIHFPDSNRNNTTEKSNQVSITGQPDDAEKARIMIRQFLPLTFSFDVPITDMLYSIPPEWSIIFEEVKKQYNLSLVLKTQPSRQVGSVNCVSIFVRGCERFAHNAIDGTKLLLTHIFGSRMKDISVTIVLDIAPHHHEMVKTFCHSRDLNLLTDTQIIFPNLDVKRPSIEKSPVKIIGSVDGVYKAKKAILGYLPVLLTFDLSEDHQFCQLGSKKEISRYGVEIIQKPKPRDGRVTVIVKGTEGDMTTLYSVRQLILNESGDGLSLPKTINNIPPTWHDPGFLHTNSSDLYGQRHSSGGWSSAIGSPSATSSRSEQQFFDSSLYSRLNPISSLQISSDLGFFSGPSSTTSSLSSPGQSPRFGTPIEFNNNLSTITERSTPYSHNENAFSKVLSGIGQMNLDFTRTSTPLLVSSDNVSLIDDLSAKANEISKEKCSADSVDLDETLTSYSVDYYEKRLLANKAMQKRMDKPAVRIPTDSWHGYGFSASMPSADRRQDLDLTFEQNGSPSVENERKDSDLWSSKPSASSVVSKNDGMLMKRFDGSLATSNYIDSTPASLSSTSISKCSTLDDVLTTLGLTKYASLFHKQEIDLQSLKDLTENDLTYLGITKLGPRRKLLAAIAYLNSKAPISPAPGAERKRNGW